METAGLEMLGLDHVRQAVKAVTYQALSRRPSSPRPLSKWAQGASRQRGENYVHLDVPRRWLGGLAGERRVGETAEK